MVSRVPRRPEELTAARLTSCLRHAGALRDGSVTGFEAEQIGVGRGFAGRIYRLHLRYDRTEPGAPPTLIGKFAAEHVTTRAMMTELGGYFKEVRFYRELAGEAGMDDPRDLAAPPHLQHLPGHRARYGAAPRDPVERRIV